MSVVDARSSVAATAATRPYSEVQKGYTCFVNGDVLLAKITPCFENGKIAEARVQSVCAFGSTEFHVLRAKPEKLDPRYLVHFLRRDEVLIEGERKMTGSAGQRRVPKHFLESLQIPLPSLTEQRRIAAILDKADALRVARRQASTYVDALTQSIFVEMFGDPVQNSRGWPTVKLADVGRLDRGVSKHRPRNAPELLGGVYPLIQTGDVANSDGYIRTYASTYSALGLKQSKLWPKGTLCITIAANIAKTGIIEFDACFPDSVVGFSAEEPGTTEYVRVWLSFLQKWLEEIAPESAQKNINLAVLRNLEIPLPPVEKRSEFLTMLREHECVRRNLRKSLTEIDQLFSSLQHRAFTGTL
jgi:type I restriction enzyme S subunit